MNLHRAYLVFSFLFCVVLANPLLAGTTVTVDDYAAANANNTPRTISGNASLQTNGQNSLGNDSINDTAYMRLVPNAGSQAGFCTNNVTVNGNSNRVLIDFDVRCMNGTATPADGMGIALLNTGNHGTTGVVTWPTGEVPSVAGSLGIGLNVYNGNAGGTQLRVYFNSAQVGNAVVLSAAPFNYNLYRGTGQPNTLAYDHISIDVNLAGATVSMTVTPAGGTAIPVLTNFAVPGLTPYRWRMGFGARTGGSNAIFDIDNLFARDPTPPTITSVNSPLTIPEDTLNAPVNFTVTDPDSTTFTYTLTPPTNGTLSGTAPSFTYTPNANFFGTDSFTLVATDTDGFASAPFTVPITITPVNDGPPVVNPDSASTSDSQAVTFPVLTNDTVLDTPFTLTIVTPPQHGSAVLNADRTITYVPDAGYAGADALVYRISDFDNDFATATVSLTVLPVAPLITSPLSANAISTLPFSYTITSSGTQPIAFTAAPLPPGVVLVGATLQGFVPPGSYAVTLSATNGSGTDVKTLVINAITLIPNQDTDGDGFPDEFEVAVGSSPVDAQSTPLTVLRNEAGQLSAGALPGYVQAQPFFLSRAGVSMKLDFASTRPARDAVSVSGSLPLPAFFAAQTQAVAVFVGGAGVSGVLDSRGQYANAARTVKIKIAKTRTSLAGRNAPFSAKFRGVYAGTFTDEGYVNANLKNAGGKVSVYVVVGSAYFTATARTLYSAKLGQSGSVKTAR